MEDEAGARPGEPETWGPVETQFSGRVTDPAVLACWGAGHMALLSALADAMAETEPLPPETVMAQPRETMAIHRFPEPPGTEWRWPSGHIDHASDNWLAIPRPVRIASMTFFTPADTHASGATVFWPGVHAKLAKVAETAASMAEVAQAGEEAQAGFTPVEVAPAAGDVVRLSPFAALLRNR